MANEEIDREERDKKVITSKKKLGDLLLEAGLITVDQLNTGLELQQKTKKRLGQALIDLKFVTEEDIAVILALQLKIPVVDIHNTPVEPEAVELLPEKFAKKYTCLPIKVENRTLTLAMADPLDLNAIDDIRFITGYEVKPVVSTPSEIIEGIKKFYHIEDSIKDFAGDIMLDSAGIEVIEEEKEEEEEETIREEQAPFVKMVDLIIKDAIHKRASDIHIEPQREAVQIRHRIDGFLQDVIKLPKWSQAILVQRVKILANMNITEKRLPQDGKVRAKVGRKEVDLRVSTLPTHYGEKVVIRILDQSEAMLNLENLGFSDYNEEKLRSFIERAEGMILVTGPTGSGKSSTLYACLNELKSETVNIITVEDPIEYDLTGVNQVQINEKVGLTFAYVLRSILRQDPNIIMVGEIRDPETAEIAVQASLTGHLVFSTLHTNDAVSAISRMINLGVPPFLLASSLIGVVAQRLVRKVCPHCKTEYRPPRKILQNFNLDKKNIDFKFYRGKGCEFCNNTGYFGRTAIAEMLTISPRIRDLIHAGASDHAIREVALSEGFVTLTEDGIEKVKKGVTTIEEIFRVVGKKEDLVTICPNCKRSVSASFEACPFCGEPLGNVCENCGKALHIEWVVCPYCGTPVTKNTPT